MSSKTNIALLGPTEFIGQLKQQARSEASILVLGESGTGKEVTARALHEFSNRSDGPFIAVNCSSIPHDLLESKFFGHKKGAFTGADSDSKGLFKAAHRGTLFLDEVGDMPLALQPKLLRAIQFQTFYPVGSEEETKVDVRIIAATNCSLKNRIAQGLFRSDLFYRLNVLSVHLKPLRERLNDFPQLLGYFLKKYEIKYGIRKTQISEPALQKLYDYSWPGNLRELENLAHRITVLTTQNQNAEKLVRLYDLELSFPELFKSEPKQTEHPTSCSDLPQAVADFEKALILRALHENNWVKALTAKALNLKRPTLHQKIKKYKIQQPQSEMPLFSANLDID